jgi:hypothetical protein
MSNVPRGWTSNEGRHHADTARRPVLVRLPNISGDAPAERSSKSESPGGVEYRFDPPQNGKLSGHTPDSVQVSASQQPHAFERGRLKGERGFPRRESPILPRSNPFANPRPRLVDSIAPAVRFLTMVALFTAAGIWIQMMGHHAPATTQSIESPAPKTASQPATAAKNADDHTSPAPTATGPLETLPDSGVRVGRARADDFATRGNSAAGPVPTSHPTARPPHFLVSSGNHVPRVRVADSTPPIAAERSAPVPSAISNDVSKCESTDHTGSDESPEVARYPGFLIDTPTR